MSDESDDDRIVPFPRKPYRKTQQATDKELDAIFSAMKEGLEIATPREVGSDSTDDQQEEEFSIDPSDPDAIQCTKCGQWNYISFEKQTCSREECQFNIYRDIVDQHAQAEIARLSKKRDQIQWAAIILVAIGMATIGIDLQFLNGPHFWSMVPGIAFVAIGFLIENNSTAIKQQIRSIAQERGIPL